MPLPARRHILFAGLALVAVVACFAAPVSEHAKAAAERALTRGIVTFGVVRTLDGVISVAQGTEVAVEPGGVGVNFTVGEILDPINDLVERFSFVMLVATGSLFLQNLLLRISEWWGFTLFVVLAALTYTGALWVAGERGRWLQKLAFRTLLVAVFLRFSVVFLVLAASLVFDTFLERDQVAATQALEVAGEEVRALNEESVTTVPADDASLLERLGSALDQSLGAVNIKQRLERLRDRMANASEHIIELIVIFVLHTVIVPLVFLWLLIAGLKFLAGRAVSV